MAALQENGYVDVHVSQDTGHNQQNIHPLQIDAYHRMRDKARSSILKNQDTNNRNPTAR